MWIRLVFLIDINAILKQALDRSPAYGSIKDVLQTLKADEVYSFL
jgi:hypothetical protein